MGKEKVTEMRKSESVVHNPDDLRDLVASVPGPEEAQPPRHQDTKPAAGETPAPADEVQTSAALDAAERVDAQALEWLVRLVAPQLGQIPPGPVRNKVEEMLREAELASARVFGR